MPTKFNEFLKFMKECGILNGDQIKTLECQTPEPLEEADILQTITIFFMGLQRNDFLVISSNLYQKFISGYDSLRGYSKDLAFIKSIIGEPAAAAPKKQITKKNEKNSGSKSNGKFDKLYFDSKQKEEFLKIKKQIYATESLKDCTFTPQINQNKIISKKLDVPVFERLSQQTTKNIKGHQEKQKDLTEMQECTFRPQILKFINQNNLEKEGLAFERLYNNAENIRQNLKIKKQTYDEMENKDVNFAPEINHTSSIIMNKIRSDNGNPFERLYNVALDQKMQPKNEEKIRKNDINECTFKPETTLTECYQKNSKIIKENKNSNIFERLYNHDLKMKTTTFSHIPNNVIEKKNGKEETPIFNKLYNQRYVKEQKIEELKKEYYKESGITFRPKINKSSRNTPRKLSISSLQNSSAKKSKPSLNKKFLNNSFSTRSNNLDKKKENNNKSVILNSTKKKNKYFEAESKKDSLPNPFEGTTFVDQMEKFVENSKS